jgi:hypothetical protein
VASEQSEPVQVEEAIGPVTDFPTAQSLVRLRLLAEGAARRADDISEAGRHQALIALDGACEHALWLAARKDGVRVKSGQGSGVPVLHSAITQQRSKWKLQGWPGVDQMHQARNGAQHAGVAPDRGQMTAWADAALAFINSLCIAAFETELKDVVLASAVRHPELRGMLTSAEVVVSENARQSFAASEMAFGIARARWRVQRQAAVPSATPTLVEPVLQSAESQSISDLADALGSLEDVLEVQPFAGDLSEYIWFQRVSRERASAGWTPDEDEARRALVFVAGWVVRWEIFAFGYPEDRWRAHRDSVEPSHHGDGKTVAIIGAQADLLSEATGQPPRNMLYLQLANVPKRGRPPWDAVLEQAVGDAMRGRRTEQEEPIYLRSYWNYSGVLSVMFNLHADAALVIEILEGAVKVAAERYAEHLVETEEKEHTRKGLEQRLRAIITEASTEQAVFGEASVMRDEWLGTLGLIALIPIRANVAGGDPLESYYVQQAFNGQRLHFPNFHQRGDSLAFGLNEITEEVEKAIRTAVANADTQVAHLRRIRLQQAQTHSQFAARIREHFGPLPERGRR